MSWLDRRSDDGEGEGWLSVSDLMAGLMVVFLFIAITYIRPLAETRTRVADIVTAWQDDRRAIYDALEIEFAQDLPRWDAALDRQTLTVRFRAPDVLFERGTAALTPRFEAILDEFAPRYLAVLARFADRIEEVRVEGHTSSEWNEDTPPDIAYFNNMALSQERTRAVLERALALPRVDPLRDWARSVLTANGLSSSRLVLGPDGAEDAGASRRVEFRVRTDAARRIEAIVESLE